MLAIIAALVSVGDSRSSAAEVVATRLDGRTTSGQLTTWNANALAIATDQGEQSVSLDQLLSVKFPAAASASRADAANLPFVELIDGTRIPVADYRVSRGQSAGISLRERRRKSKGDQLSRPASCRRPLADSFAGNGGTMG